MVNYIARVDNLPRTDHTISDFTMPELPEVETIARQLRPNLIGKRISKVSVLHPRSWLGSHPQVLGSKVIGIERRAKLIRVMLDNHHSLMIHLKMTGQLLYQMGEKRLGGGHPTSDWSSTLPNSHTRVVLTMDDNSQLFFNDIRIFGWVKVVSDDWINEYFQSLAPDIIDPKINQNNFYMALQNHRVPIKQLILQGSVVSGVGNIYVCDGLHLAGIHPQVPANKLNKLQSKKLLLSLRSVIELGIKTGGATINNYRDLNGFGGSYQNHLRVYKRAGELCLECSAEVIKIKQAGRSTFFCPVCQKA